MVSLQSYQPKQPFFELGSERFLACEGTVNGPVAQYYSFEKSNHFDRRTVVVPDGTVDILFNCSPERPKAVVCGSVKRGKEIEIDRGAVYFGVRFFPAAAEQILECPLDQFTECEIPLRDVRQNADSLLDLIRLADSFQKRVELFEQYCAVYRHDSNPVPAIVAYMLEDIHKHMGKVRIRDLEQKTGYSSRHLEVQFKKHVGIGPKLYSRIIRFQGILDRIQSDGGSDYCDLAGEAGYCDQAHFINEFKAFSLSTPTQILWSR